MPFSIDYCERRGARIADIEEFGAGLVSMSCDDDHCRINDYGCLTGPRADMLFAVQTSETHFRFMPGPEFSPRLYRGEAVFHEECVPSVFRGLCNAEALYWAAKQIELEALVAKHPAAQDLAASRIGALTFGSSIEAIAQHYGYKTQLLDFSRSRDVAMFFATCAYDEEIERYRPLCSGKAVLYTVDVAKLIRQRQGDASMIPLGLEPLPRPEAQRAMAVRMMPGENLNDMEWVNREFFDITPELSSRYYQMFEEGEKLFPRNPFDELIRECRSSGVLPIDCLRQGLAVGRIAQHHRGIEGVIEELKAVGYDVVDRTSDVDEAIIQDAAMDWVRKRSAYCGRIEVRCVADHYVAE